MNTEEDNFPPYDKIAHFMVALISVVFVLYIGAGIILPLLFSLLFSILLNPVVNFLHRKHLPRILAIALVITLSMLLLAGLLFILFAQLSLLSNMLPELKIQLNNISQQIIWWISNEYGLPINKLDEILNNTLADGFSNTTYLVGQALLKVSGAIVIIFLIPVYVFMILFYKPLIMEFIRKLSVRQKRNNIEEVLLSSKSLVQSYLTGLLIEFIIISSLNTIGLLIIGVDFALLLGTLGGLLNIIPYIGGLVAVAVTMVIALTTQSPAAAFWVLIIYIVVQFMDNNILMPYVVASKVKINALTSIIVVLIGNAIWGTPGMFLSIPLTAIVKVIFDRIDSLKPYGFLLGDVIPTKKTPFFKKIKSLK